MQLVFLLQFTVILVFGTYFEIIINRNLTELSKNKFKVKMLLTNRLAL